MISNKWSQPYLTRKVQRMRIHADDLAVDGPATPTTFRRRPFGAARDDLGGEIDIERLKSNA